MLGRTRFLYNVPSVARYLDRAPKWVERRAEMWPNVGVMVGGHIVFERRDVNRLVWLSKNSEYRGPAPWGEEPEVRQKFYTTKEAAELLGITTPRLLKHSANHRQAIGIRCGSFNVYTPRCINRVKEIHKTHGKALYAWDGAIYEEDPDLKLFTVDQTLLSEYDAFAEEHKGVIVREQEQREERKTDKKKDRGLTRRNMLGIYLPDHIADWVEVCAAREYKSKSDIGLEALIKLKEMKGD